MRRRRIRLLHVTTVPQTLSFFNGQIGFLLERGYDIETSASPSAPESLFSAPPGLAFHPIAMARSIAPLKDGLALFRLYRLFRARRPDIVHSHTPKAGLLGTLAARAARVPAVVLSVFGLPQMTMSGWKRRILDVLTRTMCALAHRVWCDSPSMRDYLVARRLCARRKAVVMGSGSVSGVDTEKVFSPLVHGLEDRRAIRSRYGIPASAQVLGYVGRIVKEKGMRELAEAWRCLGAERPGLHLILIGAWEPSDPLPAADEALFRSEPRIHLVGPTREVAAHMAAMDLFVMPSYREGFGLANIEASAMELPVVSTRIPGCLDSVLDGVSGTLVPPRAVPPLIETLRTYLDDPGLCRRHGLAGRQRAMEEFRPEAIWQDLYRMYSALLGIPAGAKELSS